MKRDASKALVVIIFILLAGSMLTACGQRVPLPPAQDRVHDSNAY